MINTPWIIGFSVLDTIACNSGGAAALTQEFYRRLVRAKQAGHLPGGLVEIEFVGWAHGRWQWIIRSVRPDMHRALTELVIAWQETEDVDSVEVAP
jgi:hypothetical protein